MSHQTLQRLPSRVGAFADRLEASVARTFAVGKAVSSREPLSTDSSYFPLTERGLPTKEFRPLFVSRAKFSVGLPHMFRIDLNSDLLSLTLGNLKLVVS